MTDKSYSGEKLGNYQKKGKVKLPIFHGNGEHEIPVYGVHKPFSKSFRSISIYTVINIRLNNNLCSMWCILIGYSTGLKS